MRGMSSARCWSSDTYNPVPGIMDGVPSSRDYEGGFATNLMLKDLNLALDAAKQVGAPVPTGELAEALYARARDEGGLGGKDFGSIYKFFASLAAKP